MNILFVHEIDWLRKVVFEIHTLSELLSRRGHRVYAIDYESMWARDGAFDFGSLKTKVVEKVARSYPDAAVTLIRPGFIKVPGLSRLTAACTHRGVIRRTIKEKAIDVIILYSIPTNGLQTIGAARGPGVPVVFRSIDILHELVSNSLLSRLTLWLEKKIYSRVDLVLTISPRLSRYVTEKGAPPERVRLLPLGVDTDLFRPGTEDAGLRRQWGLGEGPVVEFIGTLFDFSGLDDFIRRFPEVLKRVPEARLLIVGDGPQRPRLEKEIAAAGLGGRVVITGFQPFEAMPRYINLAAVCINTFRLTEATRDIFPTKIVQYLACGRPVVATPLPGMQSIVAGEGQGVVYAGAEDMEARVADLLESAEKRRELGRAAREYARQTHGYDGIVKELEAVLAELAGRGKAI
ncbi:MAG TPA: glycosyltransferase family 4 protein [Dehalococcoidales bacterium]|nr:MAG: hypothetical protein A2Z05_02115 [Chloroflexi bacterium RBG_16_60_22]HJX12043.1 glycosyltransferase family 4 protein [Dehalococcoidales bacterium]